MTGLTFEQWCTQRNAMARRNRAALEKARATGAKTWVCEEFRRGADDVMRAAKKQVVLSDPTAQQRQLGHPFGRAPRQAANARRRGSRRTPNATRAGPDGESEEPEPPPIGRLCRCGCRADISHKAPQARYLNDAHAAADRQRRKRQRDKEPGEGDIGSSAARCGCDPPRNLLDGDRCVHCGRDRRRPLTARIWFGLRPERLSAGEVVA